MAKATTILPVERVILARLTDHAAGVLPVAFASVKSAEALERPKLFIYGLNPLYQLKGEHQVTLAHKRSLRSIKPMDYRNIIYVPLHTRIADTSADTIRRFIADELHTIVLLLNQFGPISIIVKL